MNGRKKKKDFVFILNIFFYLVIKSNVLDKYGSLKSFCPTVSNSETMILSFWSYLKLQLKLYLRFQITFF